MATDPEDESTETGPDQQSGHEPTPDDCGCGSTPQQDDCDPDLLDDLTCRAAGVAAQAAYNAGAKPALDAARTKYAEVRNEYRTARGEQALAVQDLRHRVRQLLERVRCQIKQDKVIECLDDAFCNIVKKLKECGGSTGCCSTGPCEFDTSCPDSLAELLARKSAYEARLASEHACFDRLADEPEALRQRVADAKAEVDAAAAELEGDQAALDLKRLYAALLVAQRHLQQIWGGFACTQDFLDCLCHALTCWIKATEAVSVLTGRVAVKECRRDEADKRCRALAENTTDEVLLEFERLCGKDLCEPDEEPEGCDDGQDDPCDDSTDHDDDEDDDPDRGDEDCGNEHHHRHRERSS